MNNIVKRITQIGIVPVVKITSALDAIPLANALLTGGIDVAEITFRSEHALHAIQSIHETFPEMLLGAGTIRTVEQAQSAIQAGAQFIVTPGFNLSVVAWCIEHKICVLPGVSSASEIELALDYGLTTLKFFPAESSGGAKKLKDLSAPYPMVSFLPTGGIGIHNLHEYLKLPNVFAIGGSFMLDTQAIKDENWEKIEELSRDAVKHLLQYELIHIGMYPSSSQDSQMIAKTLCSLFNFTHYKKPKSHFAGKGFEILNEKGRGEHGHIGIYTAYPFRAMYQLQKQGIQFINETITRNKETNQINFVYLDFELAGFAIHLIHPDVKM